MPKSLYIINPRPPYASYFGAESFEKWGYEHAHAIADLATVTVAGMVPEGWEITICEEHVQEIDWETDADFIAITGKVNQVRRAIEIADKFRDLGKTVIMGGPNASLDPKAVREHCDILLIGELEELAERFFGDLEKGTWEKEYHAGKPDITTSPMPRFELYPNHRALSGCVQTSRGCPFACEFCDVIQYLGQKQRHKSVEQIIAELDVLYDIGYRAVFLADDNFTVYRKRAKEVLIALRDWNAKRPLGPVAFHTQGSIDAARDPEIMQLCGEAGLVRVFIGIETPNEESLKESLKRQNVGIDLIKEMQVFLDHGISVTAGMIVGFDHDGYDIFQRQYDFAMANPVPIFTLGALVAPAATPLYDRMKKAGRLIEDGSGSSIGVWSTNIRPTMMTREEMFEGLRWLGNNLYHPDNFATRVVNMIEKMGPQLGPFKAGYKPHKMRAVEAQGSGVIRKIISSGPAERRMWQRISEALREKPEAGVMVMMSMFSYAQIRCLYDTEGFWAPEGLPMPGFMEKRAVV